MSEIDPDGSGNIRATIKYGDGYQAPWLTFGGTSADEVRHDIIEAFQLDPEKANGMSLHELVIEAATIAQAAAAAVEGLGAKPVGNRGGGRSGGRSGGAWARARGGDSGESKSEEQKPAEPEKSEEELEIERLTGEIERAETTDALKRLWAENQAVFKGNKDLRSKWSAKGKSLKAAAS